MRTVFLLAGEPSGDLYAGLAARAVRELDGSVRMTGIGGPEMRAAGVELVEETSGLGVFGFWEGLTASGRLRDFAWRVKTMLNETRPDVFVPVSFSGINLRLARFARDLGIRVVYLSPPQLWAWGKWRTKRLRRATDKVICLMPFEEPFFKRLGVNAVFLGNPLVDELRQWPSGQVAKWPSETEPLPSVRSPQYSSAPRLPPFRDSAPPTFDARGGKSPEE